MPGVSYLIPRFGKGLVFGLSSEWASSQADRRHLTWFNVPSKAQSKFINSLTKTNYLSNESPLEHFLIIVSDRGVILCPKSLVLVIRSSFDEHTMENTIKLVFILVVPNRVYGQLKPLDGPEWTEHCNIQPYMYRQCCILPPFFNRDVARGCGAKFVVNFENHSNITGLQRLSEVGCRYWECMLSKYDLKSDRDKTKLDIPKFFEHLNSWVELNPDFTDVMLRAKIECKQNFRMSLPLPVCEFKDFNACLRNYINVNCPNIIETPECLEVKKFFELCHEFYQ